MALSLLLSSKPSLTPCGTFVIWLVTLVWRSNAVSASRLMLIRDILMHGLWATSKEEVVGRARRDCQGATCFSTRVREMLCRSNRPRITRERRRRRVMMRIVTKTEMGGVDTVIFVYVVRYPQARIFRVLLNLPSVDGSEERQICIYNASVSKANCMFDRLHRQLCRLPCLLSTCLRCFVDDLSIAANNLLKSFTNRRQMTIHNLGNLFLQCFKA